MTETFGELEGETCWRNGCQGVIQEKEVEGCTCHLHPPCGACTTPREYCETCDWDAEEEDKSYYFNQHIVKDNPADPQGQWLFMKPRPLDPRKIDWKYERHTNFTMKKVGVYPEGTTRAEIEAAVRGTFGGRFEYCRDGKFSYIAYTD